MEHAHSLQLRSLNSQPTLAHGQCCDLKLDNPLLGLRWWVCRLPPGHTDHRITCETWDEDKRAWVTDHIWIDNEEDSWT